MRLKKIHVKPMLAISLGHEELRGRDVAVTGLCKSSEWPLNNCEVKHTLYFGRREGGLESNYYTA